MLNLFVKLALRIYIIEPEQVLETIYPEIIEEIHPV
jgi:hypothetical protein